MLTVTLGSTGIVTPQNGFGALPVQRVTDDAAVKLLRRAYDAGITFFDTARAYSDSEHKLGLAFSAEERSKIFIATKTGATTPEAFWTDLERSLIELKTDYVRKLLFTLHIPSVRIVTATTTKITPLQKNYKS